MILRILQTSVALKLFKLVISQCLAIFVNTNNIFLAVPPLSASLVIDRKRHLVAGKESNIECKCQGSRPAPLFRWFVGTKELDTSEKIAVEHHESGEWSSSIIKYVPKAEENGKTLVCKVTNEYFPDTVLEDSHVMNVQCKFVPNLYYHQKCFFYLGIL